MEKLENKIQNALEDKTKEKKGDDKGKNLVTAKHEISAARLLKKRNAIYKNAVHLLITVLIGTVLFYWKGNGDDATTWVDHFYAAVITASSIGYGDYSFDTQSGRLLCAIYAGIAVLMTSKFVASISGYVRRFFDGFGGPFFTDEDASHCVPGEAQHTALTRTLCLPMR
jgi:voltage-gated potassium channel